MATERNAPGTRKLLSDAVSYVSLTALSLLVLFPIWLTIVRAVSPPFEYIEAGQPFLPVNADLGVFGDAWREGGLGRAMLVTVAIAVVITVAQLATSIAAAYAFAFLRFPFQRLLFGVVLATMLLPIEVTLVANDSGGAVTQMVLDADASRIARVVFTNCDAFEAFPPFPFDVLFGAARRERVFRGLARAIALAPIRYPMYRILTRRGFPKGLLADWVRPARQIPGVSRDALAFLRSAMAMDLVPISERMTEFPRPVLLCWGTGDRFFTLKLGRRLEATFPDARLVEIQDAWTFVAIDQPERLTALIAEFVQRVGSEPWLSSPSMASTN